MTEEPRSPETEAAAQETAIDSIEEKDVENPSFLERLRNAPGLRLAVAGLTLLGIVGAASKAEGRAVGEKATASAKDKGAVKSSLPDAEVTTKFYRPASETGADDEISTVFDKALYNLDGDEKIQRAKDIGGMLQFYDVKSDGKVLSLEDQDGLHETIADAKGFCRDNRVPVGQLFDLRFAKGIGVDPNEVLPTPPKSKPAKPAGAAPSEKDRIELDEIIGSVGEDHAPKEGAEDEGGANIRDVIPDVIDDPGQSGDAENPLKDNKPKS